MTFIPRQPLTSSELMKLHQFLSRSHDYATPMTLTQAHGFLTAIVSSPNMIRPSQWQLVLFGGQPDFKSQEEAMFVMGSIWRLYNLISDGLRSNNNFELALFEQEKVVSTQQQPPRLDLIAQWCAGYLRGADSDDFWATDNSAVDSLYPFAILSGQASLVDHDNETKIKQKIKILEKLPHYIKEIYTHWLKDRAKSSTVTII